MSTRPRSELKPLKTATPRVIVPNAGQEAAADARDTEAITSFFRAVLGDGAKPDCRNRVGPGRKPNKRKPKP